MEIGIYISANVIYLVRELPLPTPDLDTPSSLILTVMPWSSNPSSDMQWGQMVPPPYGSPTHLYEPAPLPLSCAYSSRQEGEPCPLICSGSTPSCPGQIWSTVAQEISTPDNELVIVTNIIPRPEAASTLNLTL